MNGSVYILKAEGINAYKIGITTGKIADRIAGLQTGCPHKIVYIFHAQVPNEQALEAKLHKHFETQKLHGEWFKLKPSQVIEVIEKIQKVQQEAAVKQIYSQTETVKKTEKRVINPELYSESYYPFQEFVPLTALPEQGVLIKLLEGFHDTLACFTVQVLKLKDDVNSLAYMRTIAYFVIAIDRIDLWEQLEMSRYYRFDDMKTPYKTE